MSRKIEFDKLLAPRLLEILAMHDTRYPVTEAETRIAMEPTGLMLHNLAPNWSDSYYADQPFNIRAILQTSVVMATAIRTGSLFLVEFDEVVGSCMGARAPVTELPMLPYPRLCVESWDDSTLPLGTGEDTVNAYIPLFIILEIKAAEQWLVTFYVQHGSQDEQQQMLAEGHAMASMLPLLVQGNGEHFQLTQKGPVPFKRTNAGWGDMVDVAIETGHLLTAHGVAVTETLPPRPFRRRHDRITNQKDSYPRLYTVEIGGEIDNADPGDGLREYYHRWMVRGHWRHFEDGRKTWVRPYIKGPAGAPWKGRPVYVMAESA